MSKLLYRQYGGVQPVLYWNHPHMVTLKILECFNGGPVKITPCKRLKDYSLSVKQETYIIMGVDRNPEPVYIMDYTNLTIIC